MGSVNLTRSDRTRTLLTWVAAAGLLAGAFTLSTGVSHASDTCVSLATAIRADLAFIAAHEPDPDPLSRAQVAARHNVVELMRQRQTAAHCPV